MTSADELAPETVRLRPEQLDERLVRYEVLRAIGHGSMGLVYEARQPGVGRRVAIKVLPPHLALRERTVRRFLREAAAMGRLAHPNIVDIFEVETSGDLHYFAMRFVEGPPLDVVLRAGPLAIQDVVNIGKDVARALAHAHARGVMHRDIKPSNLLRDGDHVVLTDFGLARPLDGRETGTMTESGDLVGTPLYMAPEQIAGEMDRIDGRCDVWGLGVTLYELLVQRPPFTGPNAQSILNSILSREPPRLRRLRDDVPRDLEAIVFKCLEKDSGRRYSGAAALLEDLEAFEAGSPVSARAPRFFDPALRWVRRRPVESLVALAMALLVALFWRSAQESSRALENTLDDLDREVINTRAAQREVDRVQELRESAHAREQILEARILWASGDELQRRRAQTDLEYLLEAYPYETHPEIALDAMETYAAWMHAQGRDGEVLGLFGGLAPAAGPGPGSQSEDLALRAAMWTGLERYREALAAHRERARLAPRDPRPFLDAAGILRRMAEGQRATLEEDRRLANLHAALRFHADALELAVPAADRECITEVLIDRARCWLELGLTDEAQRDLERLLEHDPARADARALLFAAERGGLAAVAELAAEPEPAAVPPAEPLTLESIQPVDLNTRDLEEAGEGFRVLFRGLGELLGQPEPAADDAAPEEDAQ